jgi:Tfp pilus assembly protein PilO
MLIHNKKWKNYIVLSLAVAVIIVLLEIIPRYAGLVSLCYDFYLRGANTNETNNIETEKKLSAENKNIKEKINKLITSSEDNQKISAIISLLDEAAYGKGVDIASIKPINIKKQENLWVQPIEVNLYSDYEGIFNFVRHIERSSKVILIKELDYAAKVPLNDSLLVKACLEVYLNL